MVYPNDWSYTKKVYTHGEKISTKRKYIRRINIHGENISTERYTNKKDIKRKKVKYEKAYLKKHTYMERHL